MRQEVCQDQGSLDGADGVFRCHVYDRSVALGFSMP